MDFVKQEDPKLIDEINYRVYLENLQKTHPMDTDYQHTQLSMEHLHQLMQSPLNATTIVQNFQIPLSPRQMSTLMLKTNPLTRNINLNELPHLARNLNDIDLSQMQEIHNLRNDDIARNLDLLPRGPEIDQNLIQGLMEQDLRLNDLNQISRIMEAMPQLRADLPHNLSQDMDLSHLNQELVHERRPISQESLLEQNLARFTTDVNQRLDQNVGQIGQSLVQSTRLVSTNVPMPFHIKSEQEDDGYFYDNINQIAVNGMNGHLPVQSQPATSVQQDPLYVYNNQNLNVAALNQLDHLYTRPYVQNYQVNRDNPQNLVVHRQYDNSSPYHEEFKKLEQNGDDEISGKTDRCEQPKENLKPTDQNKIFYADYDSSQSFVEKNEDSDSKLVISEDLSMIKGEYACYKCNEIFPTKRGLKQHAKSCTETETEKSGKFNCTQCSYKCQSPAILKIHQRTHSGEKPFSCTMCDYKSGQKNNVAKHLLVHMKQKPFSCKYCDYRCAQKNNLVVHERTHTGDKPFACPYCEYRTVQKPNLVKHMYLHTDQKPFSCDMCSYRCVQKTNLTKHKQRHLNEKEGIEKQVTTQKPYRPRQKSVKCTLCSYKCVQKCSLEKHMQFKHNSECVDYEDIEGSVQNLSVKKDSQNSEVNDSL